MFNALSFIDLTFGSDVGVSHVPLLKIFDILAQFFFPILYKTFYGIINQILFIIKYSIFMERKCYNKLKKCSPVKLRNFKKDMHIFILYI